MSEAVEKKEINIKEDNMEIKLTKDQRAVANAAAKETTRPVLHCVHIKKGLIEATDGFILVQKKIDYDGEKEVLLDINEFKRLKDNKPLGGIILTSSTEENKVKALGQDNFILKKQSGNFPYTEPLIPKGEPVFKIALSRQVLKKLISALDNSNALVKFYFYGTASPVKIEIPAEGTVAVLMPMFCPWEGEK